MYEPKLEFSFSKRLCGRPTKCAWCYGEISAGEKCQEIACDGVSGTLHGVRECIGRWCWRERVRRCPVTVEPRWWDTDNGNIYCDYPPSEGVAIEHEGQTPLGAMDDFGVRCVVYKRKGRGYAYNFIRRDEPEWNRSSFSTEKEAMAAAVIALDEDYRSQANDPRVMHNVIGHKRHLESGRTVNVKAHERGNPDK
jgi:hypothetical protein